MSETGTNQSKEYQWPEITAIIFSVFAIAISGYALLEGRWQHQDERNTEILDAVYADWVTLAMQDDWRVQHLLAAPGTYYAVRDLARRLTADLSEEEKVRTFFKERAMANLIFTNFEHLLKQWLLAATLKDESRVQVLAEEMDYYAEVYFRNPRLLWFWSEDGGGWVGDADPSSKLWFKDHVLENPGFPLVTDPDTEGILPGFDWR